MGSLWKNAEVLLGYFFPLKKLRVNFYKNVLGYSLGDFFHKPIWSLLKTRQTLSRRLQFSQMRFISEKI
jgi:hypothetical protein